MYPCRQASCPGYADPVEHVEMEGVGFNGEDIVLLMEKRVCAFCRSWYYVEVAELPKEEA